MSRGHTRPGPGRDKQQALLGAPVLASPALAQGHDPDGPGAAPLMAGEVVKVAVEPTAARRLAWGVFCITLAVYTLTASGHLSGQDQEYYYRMAKAVALEHSFAVEPQVFSGFELTGRRGVDGLFYAVYAPGLPVALAPVVLLGHNLTGTMASLGPAYVWTRADGPDLAARILASYFNAPVTAATAGLLALLVIRLGYPLPTAALVALSFAFATAAWGHARVLFSEPLQTFFMVLGFVLLLRAQPRHALLGGTVLGLAVLVKLTSLLAVPAVLLLPDSRGRPLWRSPTAAAATLGGVAAGAALYGIYNVMRFGSPLNTGYGPSGAPTDLDAYNPLVGLFALLLSPGHGLFWYAPPAAAALVVYWRFRREQPLMGLALLALVSVWLAAHSVILWDPGWAWGPRYLLPILPLLLVPMAAALERPSTRRMALAVVGIGFLVQIPGASVDFMAAGREAARAFSEQCRGCSLQDFHNWRNFDPAGSELRWHVALLADGRLDLAWATFGNNGLLTVTGLGAAVLGLSGVSTLRRALEQVASGTTRVPSVPGILGPALPESRVPASKRRRKRRYVSRQE